MKLQTACTDGILWEVFMVRLKQEQKKDASNHHNPGDGG
jgi:hypothetical protein